MKSIDIFFHSVPEVKEFADIVSNMKGDVKLSDERHSVDAKSIIGIFCLNWRRVLKLEVENWDEKYESLLTKYIVEYR